jgi:hypothetical protein
VLTGVEYHKNALRREASFRQDGDGTLDTEGERMQASFNKEAS